MIRRTDLAQELRSPNVDAIRPAAGRQSTVGVTNRRKDPWTEEHHGEPLIGTQPDRPGHPGRVPSPYGWSATRQADREGVL